MRRDRERGQAVPLLVLLVTVVAAALVALGAMGRLLIDRASAHAAADAAALAAVHGGRSEADAIARANHGVLVAFREGNGWVEVRVRVGRASASARAAGMVVNRQTPAPSPPTTQGYARNRAGPGT
jgi:hypothetical protein